MADLMAMTGSSVKGFSVGQKVKGTIASKNASSLILDIGGKSEGIVAEKAFQEAKEFIKGLNVGDEVTATVLIPETREGNVLLSLRQATMDSVWNKLEEANQSGKPVAVFGKGVNPSGVTVDVDGLLGFIPGSQLGKEISANPDELIGKYFKAKIIETDRLANKIVLSEKMVSEAEDIQKAKDALAKIKEGEVYDGVVTTVAGFGCFVRIKIGETKTLSIEGLVHISELSWGKVESASDIVKEKDNVKVKVIGVKDGKLALSMKRAQKDPWGDASKKYPPEARVQGRVTKVSDFGVFVELEPGVEGLIHVTQIPPGKKLKEDDTVDCYVQDLDTKAKKLSLGLVLTSKPIGYK
jgi:ribosomal protein S1